MQMCRQLPHALGTRKCATFEHLGMDLQQVQSDIELLIEEGNFPDTKSQQNFLRDVKEAIDRMTTFIEAWDEMSAVYDDGEVLAAKQCFWVASKKSPCLKTFPWFVFGANRAKPPTEHLLAEAEKKGLDVHLRTQRLPRGCLLIVELWRKDVTSVVDPILQVRYHWVNACILSFIDFY